jgi:hypothetical protein
VCGVRCEGESGGAGTDEQESPELHGGARLAHTRRDSRTIWRVPRLFAARRWPRACRRCRWS